MSSSKRVRTPANQVYDCIASAKKNDVVTPKQSIKKHATYGKKSSSKKISHDRVWEWDKILKEQSIEDKVNFPNDQHVDRDSKAPIEKLRCKPSTGTDNHDTVFIEKSEPLSRKPKISVDTINNTSDHLELDNKSRRKRRKKSISSSLSVKSVDHSKNLSKKACNFPVRSKLEDISKHDKFEKKVLSLSNEKCLPSINHNSNEGKITPKSSEQSKDFPLTQGQNQSNLTLVPRTPDNAHDLEIPSSQSPGTPLLLSYQGIRKASSSPKEKQAITPTRTNVKKNTVVSPQENTNFRIKDSYFSSTDINYTKNLPSTPSPLKSRCTCVKTIPDSFSGISQMNNLISPTTLSYQKCSENCVYDSQTVKLFGLAAQKLFEMPGAEDKANENQHEPPELKKKIEIPDSEAESEEELEHGNNLSARQEGSIEEINLENTFAPKNQSYYFEAYTSSVDPSSEMTKNINNLEGRSKSRYEETIESQTHLEVARLVAPGEYLEAARREEELPSCKMFSTAENFKPFEGSFKEDGHQNKIIQYGSPQNLSPQFVTQMAPITRDSDVFISIDSQRITEIMNRTRNHELRRYKLPPSVRRVWLYERSPVSAVKYVAEISSAKRPGDIIDPVGIGNMAFNAKKKTTSWIAYEILGLYELASSLTLNELQAKEWLKIAPDPTKWIDIQPAVVDELVANIKRDMFDGIPDSNPPMPITDAQHFKDPFFTTAGNLTQFLSSQDHSNDQIKNNETIYSTRKIKETSPKFRSGTYASSQATTVDLTQARTPSHGSNIDYISESPLQSHSISSPLRLPRLQINHAPRNSKQETNTDFLMESPQPFTKSQLLPESLFNGFPSIPISEDIEDESSNK
ncbi:BgTH12-05118 [Blumeria graminis f. sp. triticale]|uniref:Uncharacterized protein n=4 Tax=Blumeria graminis TaxID=34373 RepID=A0A656KN88_BLUGR|nr:hypothetical protein BGT96224_261 [Blumeria graminis f. sp. tritici 96224]CAD6502526.1 BgTH12-05118 [Blumeria graminis f. sp. triticale]VDB87898.1 Bgt-261 [Blumeria graminis f. sp. tritici]